jgi:hypothetical protein
MRIIGANSVVASALVAIILLCVEPVLAQYDSLTGAGAPNRHGSHGPTRPQGYRGGDDAVQNPSLALYEPVNIPPSDPDEVGSIVPSEHGYSVMIDGGLYNTGDSLFGGKIKSIAQDNIVMEFPKVIITQGKIDITYKQGDKIKKPVRRPILSDNQDVGELERQYYEAALLEVQDNNFDPGIIAKAMSDAMGNQDLVTSLYIKYRVGQLDKAHKDEIAKKLEVSRRLAILKAQEAKTITFVTTIDKQTAKLALKYFLPLVVAIVIAWGIFLFTEWSKKW